MCVSPVVMIFSVVEEYSMCVMMTVRLTGCPTHLKVMSSVEGEWVVMGLTTKEQLLVGWVVWVGGGGMVVGGVPLYITSAIILGGLPRRGC